MRTDVNQFVYSCWRHALVVVTSVQVVVGTAACGPQQEKHKLQGPVNAKGKWTSAPSKTPALLAGVPMLGVSDVGGRWSSRNVSILMLLWWLASGRARANFIL